MKQFCFLLDCGGDSVNLYMWLNDIEPHIKYTIKKACAKTDDIQVRHEV